MFAASLVCNPNSRKGFLKKCGITVSLYYGIAGDRGNRGLLREGGSAHRLIFLARFSISRIHNKHNRDPRLHHPPPRRRAQPRQVAVMARCGPVDEHDVVREADVFRLAEME